jgi:hypothetical protein
MTAEEYFPAVEEAAVVYDDVATEIDEMYSAALSKTIADFAASGASADDQVALGDLAAEAASQAVVALGGTGAALEQYGDTLASLDPPVLAEHAHRELTASLAALVAGVAPTLDQLTAVAGVDDLAPAVAGSPFTDALPRLHRACAALQMIGETNGVPVDLRCGGAANAVGDAP